MAILNFPPTAGELTDGSFTYEDNGVLYSWDGYKWTANSESGFDNVYVEVAGDNMTGDLTLGTDKITLNATDGEITAAGDVKIGGTLPASPNITLNPGGEIYTKKYGGIFMKDVGTYDYGVFMTQNAANTTDYLAFNAGQVGGTAAGRMVIDGSTGTIGIGGTLPASPNIKLNANGTAEFAGNISGGPKKTYNDNLRGCFIDSSGYIGVNSNTGTVDNQDLMVLQRGKLSGGPAGDGAKFTVKNNGSAILAGDIQQGNITDDNTNYIQSRISSTPLVKVNNPASTGGTTLLYGGNIQIQFDDSLKGDSQTQLINVYPASNGLDTYFRVAADGNGFFKGSVTSANSFAIQLEADDDTKYTATTNEDGEQTLVYNGAVLDVKERLTKTDAALQSLKAALVSTTDHASLKEALITALADI